MKTTKLFECIAALVLSFAAASCSDEPNGGSHGLSGSKVAFSTKVSLDNNTKKIYLGEPSGDNIPVLWGSDDKVTIYSTGVNGAHSPFQMGVYTITPTIDDESNASLEYSDGDEIVWVASGIQVFTSVLGNGSMTGDHGQGHPDAYAYTIPAAQTGAEATSSNGNPAAVAFADDYSVSNGNVRLNYRLDPGVIRLTIPEGDAITHVKFHDDVKPLSGTIKKEYSSSYQFVDDGDDIIVDLSSNPVTEGRVIEVYTLPFKFDNLAITVSGPTGYCTKTVSAINQHDGSGEVTDVSFGDNYKLTEHQFVMKVNTAGSYVLANQWDSKIHYSVSGTSTAGGELSQKGTTTLTLSVGDIVCVWEIESGITFRDWEDNQTDDPFIKLTTSGGDISLISMPPMNCFTVDIEGTTAGDYFFSEFNDEGALTSLPKGSFDTRNIVKTGSHFFEQFNYQGALTELPAGSFNTSKITEVAEGFFYCFNNYGSLTSLPEGSFDTSKITAAGQNFFSYFNDNGRLTELPDGSFNTSKITTANDNFFHHFNASGHLKKLPDGSFDTKNITTVKNHFFSYFNAYSDDLTSLPAGSFNTSNINNTVGQHFFSNFNNDGGLTSLPAGSFDTSNITNGTYANFFENFNVSGGKLPQYSTSSKVTITNKSNGNVIFHYWNGSTQTAPAVSPNGTFDYQAQ